MNPFVHYQLRFARNCTSRPPIPSPRPDQPFARDVNRRPGLNDDSTVGKAIATSASIGAKIPLTEIAANATAEGRAVDQQTLLSAYDFARRATENAQLSQASTLLKDFRSSNAYQWARRAVPGVGSDGN